MRPALTEVEAALRELEATPLLGPGLERARALDEALMRLLGQRPDAALATRALLRRGERLLAEGDEAAAATLAEAAERARALGAAAHDLRARLLTVRALARVGSLADARALLERAAREAEGDEELALDRALALAAVGARGAVEELERALAAEDLDPVARAHELLAATRALAEGRAADARWDEADRHYARAVALAEAHGAPGLPTRLSLSRALTLIRFGRSRDSVAPLRQVFQSGDSLLRLTAGLLLSGQLIQWGARAEAAEVARACVGLARARRNWLAFSAATLDLAWLAEQDGGLPAARAVLTEGLAVCRAEGEPGVLLQARWQELTGAQG